MMRKYILLLVLSFTWISCTNDIVQMSNCEDAIPSNVSMLVLCEGIYGYDNASLWGIRESGSSELFACRNSRKLGDTANDLIKISDSTIIIIVSTSNEILKIDRNGTIISSFQVKGPGHFLKKGCIINDSSIAITDLYADKIYVFNHADMSLDSLNIPNLCAPDGIAYGNGNIVIANSGYGVFRKNELNASTIAIYDEKTKITHFKNAGTNPQSIMFDDYTNQWFIQYAHLTTMPDSVGGLMIFDESLNKIAHHRGQFIGMPVRNKDAIHALCGTSIIRMHNSGITLDTVFTNTSRNQWYRIGSIQNRLYICNARNYSLPGSLLFLNDQSSAILREVTVGVNPSIVIRVE